LPTKTFGVGIWKTEVFSKAEEELKMEKEISRTGLFGNKRESYVFSRKGLSLNKIDPIKVVVRYSDGRILKGYTQNFAPDKAFFHLLPVDAEFPDQNKNISFKGLKAVFFVRDFTGNQSYIEKKIFPQGMNIIGRKIEVTFKDGEVLVGSTMGYDPGRSGFFVYPSDQNWNLLRAFVVSEAIESVRFI
jgi:hypothetical protein